MICPNCTANLGRINSAGNPMVRMRGLVLKAEGVAAICPKCKADVPIRGELAKALGARLLLVFANPRDSAA